MLIGINPLLNPKVLFALSAMGHGDTVALVDSNFPAFSTAKNTVYNKPLRMECSLPEAFAAVLSVLPIDEFVDSPINSMQVVGDSSTTPEVIVEAATKLNQQAFEINSLERFAFYEAAKQAFVIIQTNETRVYGNLLLSKGVIS